MNFISLLGWSPKNDREKMSRNELVELFSLDGINRGNAIVNFTDEEPFDPQAVWLNAEHLRALDVEELAQRLMPYAQQAGFANATPEKLHAIAPLIQERIRLLRDVGSVADFFFAEPRSYDPAELIPQKGDAALAVQALRKSKEVLSAVPAFDHATLESDDWEWGVDLFADDPLVFKRLIYEMRFDEVSAVYALFGTFYVGLRFPASELGTLLSGRAPAR